MKRIIFATAFAVIMSASFVCAESLTVTTYYPAPFGSYDRVQLVPRTDIGGTCDVGTFYVDPTGEVQYCQTGSSFEPFVKWNQNNDDIFPAETATNPNIQVGIGTTSPAASLHITGAGGAASGWRVSNTGATFNGYFASGGVGSDFYLNYVGSGAADIVVQSDGDVILAQSGDVGIGTTTPGAKLDVNGNIRLRANGTNSGPIALQWVGGTGSYYSYAVYAP